MNLAMLSLLGLAGAGAYYGMKRKDPNIRLSSCFFERVAVPFSSLFDEYISNNGLIIDLVEKDYVRTNTPLKELYAIELVGFDNTLNYLPEATIEEIFRDFKKFDDAFLFYAIHKQGKLQKQYIFSHNKNLLQVIGAVYETKLMSGQDILNVIYDLSLQNSYYVNDKMLKRSVNIDFENDKTPGFLSFKKISRQAIYKNLTELDLIQAYKAIEGVSRADIQKLFSIDFEGVVWTYFDFYTKRIEIAITSLLNAAKWSGNKEIFTSLKEQYIAGEVDLMIVNSLVFLKKYDSSTIGALGTCLKNAYIPKDIFRADSIRRTPLKYRDGEFDILMDKAYFKNYITTLHKRSYPNADIFGLDKNRAFVNYSFSGENNTPHMCIIAESGSGKSVSKQKIMAQMINLDFSTGYASELGKVKIRSYDVGFSDEVFVNLVKSNPKNNIAILSSDFASFAYNLVNVNPNASREEFEADLVFACDLMSVILESQNAEALNISELALFKEAIKKIYKDNNYRRYRVLFLKDTNTEMYEKLKNLGFDDNYYLADLEGDEFEFLRKPLLSDITAFCKVNSSNQQLKEEDRKAYSSLAMKCLAVEQLDIFSRFDKVNITDTDFLSMDLNNFKESSLFTPIFLCIFQKTYLKDRDNALKCKREKRVQPKLFYAIEESRNFFEVPYFEVMLKKLAFEARKYNVHLCFIAQLPEHIPAGILKQLSTRIFLLIPSKKGETINEIKKHFQPNEKVIEALNNTEKHELCIWYSEGVFNLKFEISDIEMAVFNTNPNIVA